MAKINPSRVPGHIAIIMDGNGRWARRRRLPRIVGHRAGAKSVEETIKAAGELGVKILTLFTFSTENWKRSKREVDALMRLLTGYLKKKTGSLLRKNVRLRAIGRISELPPEVRISLRRTEKKTAHNDGILVNLALNYGGRAEIVDACKRIAEEVKEKRLRLNDISEAKFASCLYTAGIPDPNLLIRTSGELRISNFLLWQMSYAEIYVTKKFWPDFRKKDLEKAILAYQSRERRYGG